MNHANLIVPALIVLCMLYGIVFVSIVMRDIWDDIEQPFSRRAALQWLMIITSFAMIYVMGVCAYQMLIFCLNQIWP